MGGVEVPPTDILIVATCEKNRLLGLKATDVTSSWWPVSGGPMGRASRGLATFQTRTERSSETVAILRPSGVNAKERNIPLE